MILQKEIDSADILNKKSNVKQLVDILQVDIAGVDEEGNNQNTRREYHTFVTGGTGLSPVTSSLFQTVYDQDYELQTSNEILDITIGIRHDSSIVTDASSSTDASGKPIFPDTTLMMREKINLYKQYAQVLLGDSDSAFTSPFGSTTATDKIDAAVFINIKRLFTRDSLDVGQLSFKLHSTGSAAGTNNPPVPGDFNIDSVPSTTLNLFSDTNASNNLRVTGHAGTVGEITNAANAAVGLVFYQKGIIVLDAKKVFDHDQTIIGTIDAVTSGSGGLSNTYVENSSTITMSGSLVPNFWVSGSVDDIINHVCRTRFGRGNSSAIGLINKTSINSTIYFCRLGPNEGNYSSNPTYIDDDGDVRTIQDEGDDPFSYVTTIGLYNGSNELLAVAKTSRPIEKNPEVDLTLSVRIDY